MEHSPIKENNSALGCLIAILIVLFAPLLIAGWIYSWALAAAAWHLLIKG